MQYKHALITFLQTDLHETIQYLSLVKETKWSRPQWWLDLWMDSTMSFVAWWSLGKIIGYFDSSGKKLRFSLPPTRRSSLLINGCSGKILLLYTGRFSFLIVNSLKNLSCWTLLIIKYLLFTKSSKNILSWYVLWFFFINDNQCLEIFKTKATTLTSLFQFENGSNKIKLKSFFWLTHLLLHILTRN